MANFNGFTQKYKSPKTLRFGIVPLGKTLENMNKYGIISEDRQRNENYKKIKSVLDRFYKTYIEMCLKDVKIDWGPLYEAVVAYRAERSPENRDDLESLQKRYRKTVVGLLTKNKELFKALFSKRLFDGTVASKLPGLILTAEDEALLDSFKGFTTYFDKFFKNRKNLFSAEKEHSAVSYRLVNENFTKFVTDCEILKRIGETVPDVLETLRNTSSLQLYEGCCLEEIFSADFYSSLLGQEQIERFNRLIGGISAAPGEEKVQGLNETMKVILDKSPDEELAAVPHRFVPLYKQLLIDRQAPSFILKSFGSDRDVLDAVEGYLKMLESGQALSNIRALFNGLETCADLQHVYISNDKLSAFSSSVFGQWNLCKEMLRDWKIGDKDRKITKKQTAGIDKWLKNSDFSISEIWQAAGDELPAGKIGEKILKLVDAVEERAGIPLPESLKTPEEKEILKTFLDSVMDLLSRLQWFDVDDCNGKDMGFYGPFEKALQTLRPVRLLYNQVRNHVTKKPYSLSKIRLNFSNGQLGKGWDENKITDHCAVLFTKGGQYYLGILNKNNRPDFETPIPVAGEARYKRMVYKQTKFTTTVPKCATNRKDVEAHFSVSDDDYVLFGENFANPLVITKEIYDLNHVEYGNDKNDDKHKKIQAEYLKYTGDQEGYTEALYKWIDFVKEFAKTYKRTSVNDISTVLPTEQYKNLLDFYTDMDKTAYEIVFQDIPEKVIDAFVDEGKLFLFRIETKDFRAGSTGRPNLQTLYWKALFDPENINNPVIKLNGMIELFYRPKSEMNVVRHRVGEKMVNRVLKDGRPLDNELHSEIYRYVNNMLDRRLSAKAKAVLPLVTVRDVPHELTKDRRFTEDKFFFHASIVLNNKSDKTTAGFNKDVREYLKNNPDMYVIGIDRGERNLIYAVVISPEGRIVEQKSFNVVNGFNYHHKLDQREKERIEARQAWNIVGEIKELKAGYLSNVVHEISRMMIKYNAVVVLENLNLRFKQVHGGIEKSVYQQFERQLINKLGFLVFKERTGSSPGSVLNAYQLTDSTKTMEKTGMQNGFLFYVPAAYTSAVDPTTGFCNPYVFSKVKNTKADIEEFLKGIRSLRYDRLTGDFIAHLDLSQNGRFQRELEGILPEWDVVLEANVMTKSFDGTSFIRGKRIEFRRDEYGHAQYDTYLPCQALCKALQQSGIEYKTGEDVLPPVLRKKDPVLAAAVFKALRLGLQMRNSNAETGEDYFSSVVKNGAGPCFDSRSADETMPKDADALGAYHIALKGLLALEKLRKGESMGIKNAEWLQFVQQRHS